MDRTGHGEGEMQDPLHFRSPTAHPLRQHPTNFAGSRPPSPVDPNPQRSALTSRFSMRSSDKWVLERGDTALVQLPEL